MPARGYLVSFLVSGPIRRVNKTSNEGGFCGGILRILLLGYLDSNQEQRYQKPPCCQLHHTPRRSTEVVPKIKSRRPGAACQTEGISRDGPRGRRDGGSTRPCRAVPWTRRAAARPGVR